MVDMVLLVCPACPYLQGWMESEFPSEDFFSCSLGGLFKAFRYFSVPWGMLAENLSLQIHILWSAGTTPI